MSGGGGGSNGPQEVNQTTSSIPKELMPYATQILGKGTALTNTPYQQYTGQQVAGFSPLQNQAFQNIQGLQTSGLTDQAAGMTGMGATNQFTGQNVQDYMSPYMQNVMEQQKQSAIRDYGRALPQLGTQAAQVGGLGGTRSALMQSEANRNLQNSLSGIEATGLQGAYDAARGQFNQQNQNLMQGASQLGNLGQQQFQQVAGINEALLGAGAMQQQQQQQAFNTSYNNWLAQQNDPYNKLNAMSGWLRGTPMNNQTNSVYQAPGSMAGQVAGLAGGLGHMFGALG
jgi:hypothetical protein